MSGFMSQVLMQKIIPVLRQQAFFKSRIRSVNLPDDIVSYILQLLPLKSLIRFTCVCKSWFTIIRDPTFGKLHFTQSNTEPAAILVLTYNVIGEKKAINISYMRKQKGLKLVADQTAIVNLISLHSWHLVGTCDGLLCFATSGRDEIVMICNPITREHVILPKPFPCPKSHRLMHAFGFDPTTNKYKVVRVLCRQNLRIRAEVCAVGGNSSWRKVQGFNRVPYGRPVYADGAVYWLALPYPGHLAHFDRLPQSAFIDIPNDLANKLLAYQQKRILSFDLGKEEFRMMRHMRIGYRSSLAEIDKRLSVVDINSSKSLVEVYVMKDSWEKEYSLPVPDSRYFDWKSPRLICAQERNRALLIWLQNTLMACKKKECVEAREELKLTRFPIGMDFEICSSYRDSLVSLMHFNAVGDQDQQSTNIHFVNDEVLYSTLEGNTISRDYDETRRCDKISKCFIENGILSN